MESRNQNSIRRIVQISLLIALAIVIRNLSYMAYIGGAPAMRFSFGEVFTKTAAILFGPVYGGISSGILDVTGYLMKPEGSYIPLFTVTAVLSGLITGLLWAAAGRINFRRARTVLIIFFVFLGLTGVANHLTLVYSPLSSWGKFIEGIGKNRDFATIGLEIISLIGIGLFGLSFIIRKINSKWQLQDSFSKILIAVGGSGLIISTLNTLILQYSIPELGNIPFLILWIPRIIKEILMIVVHSYIISFLLSVYKRYQKGI